MNILVAIICSIAYVAVTFIAIVCLFHIIVGAFLRISDKEVKFPIQIIGVYILSSIISFVLGFIMP